MAKLTKVEQRKLLALVKEFDDGFTRLCTRFINAHPEMCVRDFEIVVKSAFADVAFAWIEEVIKLADNGHSDRIRNGSRR